MCKGPVMGEGLVYKKNWRNNKKASVALEQNVCNSGTVGNQTRDRQGRSKIIKDLFLVRTWLKQKGKKIHPSFYKEFISDPKFSELHLAKRNREILHIYLSPHSFCLLNFQILVCCSVLRMDREFMLFLLVGVELGLTNACSGGVFK